MERRAAEGALADALAALLERIDTSHLLLDGVRPVYIGRHSQHAVLRARAVLCRRAETLRDRGDTPKETPEDTH